MLRIANSIFDIASTNKFYSELYAILYKELTGKFPVFKEIIIRFISQYLENIGKIQFIDSNKDYDLYCENNKLNDKRKAMSAFLVNLMKLELIIFGIAGFLLYNIYHDGKYSKIFVSYKKYYQMGIVALFAISLYVMIKRNPGQTKNMLLCTNNMIKYMPIDKSSMDMISPIFDLTNNVNNNGFNTSFMTALNGGAGMDPLLASQQQRNLLSGQKATKRSVSETKKKYVASIQDWKCGQCNKKLKHTFEVDHKVRLEHGGGNDVTNLVALCRDCHGDKTAMENM
jgi:hypothetical protein